MSPRPEVPALHELVAARICHDLVSPLGAIGNGLELLTMSAGTGGSGPEAALIAESAALAGARLKLFRLAFGPADEDRAMPAREVAAMIGALAPALRVVVDWKATGNLPRAEMRCACLALLCMGAALAHGGSATVTHDEAGGWHIEGHTKRLTTLPGLWELAAGTTPPPPDLAPRQVQFALLPLALAALGRRMTVVQAQDRLTLAF